MRKVIRFYFQKLSFHLIIVLLLKYVCMCFVVKNKETSNLYKFVWTVCSKILIAKIKGDKYFVDKVETQDEKNHTGAAKRKISTIQKTRLDTK
jgi:hypothetical protein